VIVQCSQCDAKYNYPDERFGEKAEKKLRCVRCGTVFAVLRPEGAGSAQPRDPETTQKRKDKPPVSLDPPAEEPPPPPKRRRRGSPSQERTEEKPLNLDAEPKLPRGYRLSLAVINGPDAGKVYRIEKPRVVIGRSAGDLMLNDSEASRAHAAIEVRESVVLLEDLGSTNGTYHRGRQVDVPLPLHNHSEFLVGNTTLMLIVTRE
jgi:predicted Zn finger-like uncharacterized protein